MMEDEDKVNENDNNVEEDDGSNSVGRSSNYNYRGLNALRHPLQALKERLNLGFLNKKKKKDSIVRKIWNGLPITTRIFITIAVVMLLLVIITILSIGDDTSKKAVTTRSKGVSKLNITDQSPEASKFALELYEKYDTLIGFSSSDLNVLYEEFQNDTSNQNKYLLSSGKKKFGSSTGEKCTIDQELSLYQHIQRTEKYNFNKIRWREYTHSADDQQIDTELNEELELYLPKGIDEETRETLLKTTAPYILTQDIPLGFLSGMVAQSGGVSSTNTNTSEKFVYQILKEALSKITVNKYVLQSIKLNSSYRECDYNRYEVTYYVNTWDNGYEEYVREDEPVFVENVKHETTKEKKMSNTEQYNSETYWYVADAFTYDRIIKNNFNYTKYNEADVQSLNNPDNNTLINTITIDEKSEDIETKKINVNGETKPVDEDGNPLPPDRRDVKKTYSYIQKQGNEYIYEKEWKDKLSAGSTENNEYSYDTAKEFNTKTDEIYTNMPTDKSLIAEDKFNEKFPSEKSIFDTFTKENSSLKLYGMSIIDLMDTNRGIYSKYLLRSESSTNLEGISREKLKPAYNQVKNILNSLINKAGSKDESATIDFNSYTTGYASEGALPFVYGSSLGYKNTYVTMNNNNSTYVSSSDLLKEYLRALEGIGSGDDPASTKIITEGDKKYYVVASNLTVGYGVDLREKVNPQWKKEIEDIIGQPVQKGTKIDVDIIDKYEENYMNEKYDKIKNDYPELKEYQIHALVVRAYNTGNADGYADHRNEYNESTDDLYETVYEQYKDNPTLVEEIKSKAVKTSVLYQNYMSQPTSAIGYSNPNILEGRRFSEWCLFSLGYYDKLQKFYNAGGGSPGGIKLIVDGKISQEAVDELRLWFEDNIFAGMWHGNEYTIDNVSSYSAKTLEAARKVQGGDIYKMTGIDTSQSHYKAVSSNGLGIFQCTWWADCRARQYLQDAGYTGTIHTRGNGGSVASNFSTDYNIKLTQNVREIKPHSIASYTRSGSSTGHVVFVEDVASDGSYVISHCGSGHKWHGVYVIPAGGTVWSGWDFAGSVCLDDLL